jgi:membrane-bound lytic murein transglycosylase F
LIKKLIFLLILPVTVIICLTYNKSSSGKENSQPSVVLSPVKMEKLLRDTIDGSFQLPCQGKALFGSIVKSYNYPLYTRRVSKYDDLIKESSARINWDWRLLASLICQESRFRPDVTSVAGAYGLMQIMPVTGKNFGVDITASPESNIKAGILYINWLNTIFESKIPEKRERLNFILASYNAGPGHVLDAMRLAEKNGMDPGKWNGNVAVWLLKKSEPQYYKDSVVKNGYFRGTESVKFVSEVLDRFEHYKSVIQEERNHPF